MKKILLKLLPLSLIAFIVVFILPNIGFDDLTAYAVDFNEFEEDLQSSAAMILAVQDLANRLLWPILIMIGGLLDNSILFGSGMEARMREIWIPIRNLVNILFVVALVGIALYNVTGLGEEGSSASIKNALPKLIIGLIVINFSFVGIKVFLDTINVVTVSIMALPDQVSEGMAEVDIANDPEATKRFCLAIAGKKRGDAAWDNEDVLKQELSLKIHKQAAKIYGIPAAELQSAKATNPKYKATVEAYEKGALCDGFTLSSNGTEFLGQYKGHNAALVLALNMGEIVYYQDVDVSVDNLEKLLTSILFSTLLYIVYAATFIALFAVLLIRLIVLWLCIVLSPVLLITIAVPAIKENVSVFAKISDKFVKHAIAPVGIALSMTIGWIMLKAMKSVSQVGSDFTVDKVFSSLDAGIPVVGLTTMQDFIVGIGTLAVVWIGVFAVADETYAKGLTDKIKGGMESLGMWVAQRPLDASFIPIRLPGKSEPQDFTLNQVSAAMNNFANSGGKDRDKLIRALGGETNARLDHLNTRVSNLPQFAQVMYNVNDSNENIQTSLKNLNQNILRQVQQDRDLAPAYQRVVDATPETLQAEVKNFNQALQAYADRTNTTLTDTSFLSGGGAAGGGGDPVTPRRPRSDRTNQNPPDPDPDRPESTEFDSDDGNTDQSTPTPKPKENKAPPPPDGISGF